MIRRVSQLGGLQKLSLKKKNADELCADWQADLDQRPVKRTRFNGPEDVSGQIHTLLEGLVASQFDDGGGEEEEEEEQASQYLFGSAEVPAETQDEEVFAASGSPSESRQCAEGCDDVDEEQYWGNETQEETELILRATQECDRPTQDCECPTLRPTPQPAFPSPPQAVPRSQILVAPSQQTRSTEPQQDPPPWSSASQDDFDLDDQHLEAFSRATHNHTLPVAAAAASAGGHSDVRFGGFQTARGGTVATPSEAARQRAQALLASSQPEPEPEAQDLAHHHHASAALDAFQTARGGSVAPPSSAALKRARHILLASSQPGYGPGLGHSSTQPRRDDVEEEDEQQDPQDLMPPPPPSSRPAFQPIIPLDLNHHESYPEPEEWRPPATTSERALLAITAGGEPRSSPDADVNDDEMGGEGEGPRTAAPPSDFSIDVSFQTGGGRTLAGPSKEALQRAQRLLAPSPSPPEMPAPQESPVPTRTNQLQRTRPMPRNQSVRAPTSVTEDSDHNPARPPPRLLLLPPPPPASTVPHRTLQRDTFKTPFQNSSSVHQRQSASQPSPSPSPLRQNARVAQSVPHPAPQVAALRSAAQPQTVARRVQTQMHGAGPRSVPRKKFRTPFKNGVRPPPGPIASQSNTPQHSQVDSPATNSGCLVLYNASEEPGSGAQLRATKGTALTRYSVRTKNPKYRAVFDLESPPPHARTPWRLAGLTLGMSAVALEALGVRPELIFMTSYSGLDYLFSSSDHTKQLGWQDAHEFLISRGARLIDDLWVQNHWSLILWKQAGLFKAMVSSGQCPATGDSDVWSFGTVCNQLLYRYEREVNQAQRSAVKRVQEQDSSPGQPMVLLISNILWTLPPSPPAELTSASQHARSEQQEARHGLFSPPSPPPPAQPQVSGFELTDGWYRINAQTDPVLSHSVMTGKLRIGTKLLIVGAKLEAGRDGSAVLEAQSNSSLVISANSTRRAAWDARLGFQAPKIYMTSLRSLSPLGGAAPLIDVVILKLYPIGFMESGEEGWEKGPWNLAEEEEKQRLWHRSRAHAEEKAVENLQKQEEDLADLTDFLESLARRSPVIVANEVEEPFEDFIESLLENDKQRSRRAASHSRGYLREAAQQARSTRQKLTDSSHEALRAEVEELCPARNIRTFRVARVTDAASRSTDTTFQAQMTIWNPAVLEELDEGRRYTISNVRPSRPNGWSRWDVPSNGEIFLTAGWNSQFRKKSTSSTLLLCSY